MRIVLSFFYSSYHNITLLVQFTRPIVTNDQGFITWLLSATQVRRRIVSNGNLGFFVIRICRNYECFSSSPNELKKHICTAVNNMSVSGYDEEHNACRIFLQFEGSFKRTHFLFWCHLLWRFRLQEILKIIAERRYSSTPRDEYSTIHRQFLYGNERFSKHRVWVVNQFEYLLHIEVFVWQGSRTFYSLRLNFQHN